MRTIITSLALAAGAAAFAQNEPVPATNATTAPTVPQAEEAFAESTYDECLLTAGTKSWQVLGLSEDQVARVSDLQARYKKAGKEAEEKALAAEKAAAKGSKGKKVKKEVEKVPEAPPVPKEEPAVPAPAPTTTVAPVVEPAAPVSTNVHEGEGTALNPPMDAQGGLEKSTDFSAADPAEMPNVPYSPYDEELRSILTPAQLSIWDRRCDSRTSMRP